MKHVEKAIKRELHEGFPGKHFNVRVKRNHRFTIQWFDKSLPARIIKRTVARVWYAMFGEKIHWGKVRDE